MDVNQFKYLLMLDKIAHLKTYLEGIESRKKQLDTWHFTYSMTGAGTTLAEDLAEKMAKTEREMESMIETYKQLSALL